MILKSEIMEHSCILVSDETDPFAVERLLAADGSLERNLNKRHHVPLSPIPETESPGQRNPAASKDNRRRGWWSCSTVRHLACECDA